MSNAQKLLDRKSKKQKEKKEPKRKVKVNTTTLLDAVVDGKLVAPVKSRVVFMRLGKLHDGIVFSVDPKDESMVTLWDDVLQQFYLIDIRQELPLLKMIV